MSGKPLGLQDMIDIKFSNHINEKPKHKKYVKFEVRQLNVDEKSLKTYKAKLALRGIKELLPITFEGYIYE